jgi:GLPGLI family protein
MNNESIKLLLVLSFALLFSSAFAQNFEGVATYVSSRKTFSPIKKEGIDDKKMHEFNQRLAKAFQKEFTLVFNQKESLFKLNKSLEKPNPASEMGVITTTFPYEFIYKNLKENTLLCEREIYGKKFLITDSIQEKLWKVLAETKMIGEYVCTKAVIPKTYKRRKVNEDGSFSFVDEEKFLVAWFTLQIPVSFGPADYSGLPGLILEVEDGRNNFMCTKIVMNPKTKIEIEVPSKGKVVSQREFDAIQKKKFEESRNNLRRRQRE